MADIDVDPFEDHDKTDEQRGENIPLTPVIDTCFYHF